MFEVLSPFKWLGQKAASASISDVSNEIIAARAEQKEQDNTIPKMNPGKALADLTAGLARDAIPAGGAASIIAPNPLAEAVSFGTGVGEIQKEHMALIEDLAEQAAPGFAYETVQVNRKPVKVWVDASGVAEGDGPVFYTKGAEDALGSSNDRFAYKKREDVLDHAVRWIEDKAVAQVQDYKAYAGTPYPETIVALSKGNDIPIDVNPIMIASVSSSVLQEARQAADPARSQTSGAIPAHETPPSSLPNTKGPGHSK